MKDDKVTKINAKLSIINIFIYTMEIGYYAKTYRAHENNSRNKDMIV